MGLQQLIAEGRVPNHGLPELGLLNRTEQGAGNRHLIRQQRRRELIPASLKPGIPRQEIRTRPGQLFFLLHPPAKRDLQRAGLALARHDQCGPGS
jgi:hypothetical protein